jgi:hypothetical protein
MSFIFTCNWHEQHGHAAAARVRVYERPSNGGPSEIIMSTEEVRQCAEQTGLLPFPSLHNCMQSQGCAF